MADIFLSYARVDQKKAKRIVNALEKLGYTVWWDTTIPAGETFDDVTEKALAAAKCVVILWSQKSVHSNWVKAEADEALRRDKLVPALLETVSIPLQFRRIQTVSLSNWRGGTSHPGFKEMVRAIEGLVEASAKSRGEASANLERGKDRRLGEKVGRSGKDRFWLRYLWLPVVVGLILVIVKFLMDTISQPKAGELHIFSATDSVVVSVNDSTLGMVHADSPLRLSWPKGQYLLRAEKAGFNLFERSINVKAGEVTSVNMQLTAQAGPPPEQTQETRTDTPAAKTYSLVVTVPDVFENAKVFVDGEWLGNASGTIPVPAGHRRVRVVHEKGWYETMLYVEKDNTLLNITQAEFKSKNMADTGR